MRKKNFKGRCTKRQMSKCTEVCRTYDPIQFAFADLLENDDCVREYRCNVPLDGLEIGEYSGLCCGYSLSWEGGIYSLKKLMLNIITDKTEYCKSFGIDINSDDWNCDKLPSTLVTDMGSEYKSENLEQLSELGITIVNLPSYRPELKGCIEKFFDMIQNLFKPYLKGKGVVEPDFQERGAHDYRKDACLTLNEFEKIILHCIIFYNSKRVINSFPYTENMLKDRGKPISSQIWNWCIGEKTANLIQTDSRQLMLTLLPRAQGTFTRFGLKVSLANALGLNWQLGKKEFYRGILSGFFKSVDPQLSGQIMDLEVKGETEGEDITFFKVLFKLDKSLKTLYWKELNYQGLQDIGKKLHQSLWNNENLNEYTDLLNNNVLSIILD